MKFSQDVTRQITGQKGNGPTQRAQSLSNNNYHTQQRQGHNVAPFSSATPGQTKNVSKSAGQNSNVQGATKTSNASSHGSKKSTDSRVQSGSNPNGQIRQSVKINKPTFNLQINNNVGNVNNSDGGAITMITKNASGVPAQNQSGDYAINLGQV